MTVGHKRIDAIDSLLVSGVLLNVHSVRLRPNEKIIPNNK